MTYDQWINEVKPEIIEAYVKDLYPDSLGMIDELPPWEAAQLQHQLSALWINYKLNN